MAYEYVETEEGYKQVVIPDPPENPPAASPVYPAVYSQRPTLLQMPFMQHLQPNNQYPFPLIFFFFPRVALLLMTQRNMLGQGQGRIGVRNITQIIRDKNGYISEIIEFVR